MWWAARYISSRLGDYSINLTDPSNIMKCIFLSFHSVLLVICVRPANVLFPLDRPTFSRLGYSIPTPASEHPLILISLWGGYLIQDTPHFGCTLLSRTIFPFGHEHDYVRSVGGSLLWTTPRHSLFQFCLVQVFDFGTADNHLEKSNQINSSPGNAIFL